MIEVLVSRCRSGAKRRDPPAAQSVALILQARAMAAGFGRRDLGGHNLKRGALTIGMEKRAHPARLKSLGRLKSYGSLGVYP